MSMNKPEIVESNDIEADFAGRKSYKTYTEMILHYFSTMFCMFPLPPLSLQRKIKGSHGPL